MPVWDEDQIKGMRQKSAGHITPFPLHDWVRVMCVGNEAMKTTAGNSNEPSLNAKHRRDFRKRSRAGPHTRHMNIRLLTPSARTSDDILT